jgi:hypothetical protein
MTDTDASLVIGQVLINAVVSMGQRNTTLEPTGIENKSQNRWLGIDPQGRCPG